LIKLPKGSEGANLGRDEMAVMIRSGLNGGSYPLEEAEQTAQRMRATGVSTCVRARYSFEGQTAKGMSLSAFAADSTRLWTKVIGPSAADGAAGVFGGADAFYATINLGAAISTIENVPITGDASATSLLLKSSRDG
jgi:hypothetical protein